MWVSIHVQVYTCIHVLAVTHSPMGWLLILHLAFHSQEYILVNQQLIKPCPPLHFSTYSLHFHAPQLHFCYLPVTLAYTPVTFLQPLLSSWIRASVTLPAIQGPEGIKIHHYSRASEQGRLGHLLTPTFEALFSLIHRSATIEHMKNHY